MNIFDGYSRLVYYNSIVMTKGIDNTNKLLWYWMVILKDNDKSKMSRLFIDNLVQYTGICYKQVHRTSLPENFIKIAALVSMEKSSKKW